MIYIASPYSDSDPAVREARYLAVKQYVEFCVRNGELVFSPILYSHPLVEACGVGLSWETWREFDEAILQSASLLRVLTLDGWQNSVGVSAEIRCAEKLGIPVEYVSIKETVNAMGNHS